MRLKALHQGVSVEQVVEATGFELIIPEQVPFTEPPTEAELALVRSLDPERRYLG